MGQRDIHTGEGLEDGNDFEAALAGFLFLDLEGALIERFGVGITSFGAVNGGERTDQGNEQRVLRVERFLFGVERLLEERFGIGVFSGGGEGGGALAQLCAAVVLGVEGGREQEGDSESGESAHCWYNLR